MKIVTIVSLFLTMSTCLAELHVVSASGLSLETADSWKHDSTENWGYLILDADNRKAIRIHNRNPNEKSLLEALNNIVQNVPKSDWPVGVVQKMRVIEVIESKTEAGAEGLRVTTGNLGRTSTGPQLYPNVWHYLFKGSSGIITCICVYNRNNSMTAEQADELVLPTLIFE